MVTSNHALTVRRAALPEVLFVPDLAEVLCRGQASTRRAVRRGDCGPYIRVGHRLAVLRTSFLGALASREVGVPAGAGKAVAS